MVTILTHDKQETGENIDLHWNSLTFEFMRNPNGIETVLQAAIDIARVNAMVLWSSV